MLELERKTFDPANSKSIIVNSEMVRREIVSNFHYPTERIFLVRNGIDIDRMRSGDRSATRRKLRLAPEDFVVLFVGSGWERKGLHFLTSALRLMDPALKIRLLVAGKGTSPSNSPRSAVFAGVMQDVENAYAAADIVVTLPSYEPSANVVFEALAAGLPVISSVHNGAAELIREGVDGSTIQDPSDALRVAESLHHWATRGPGQRLTYHSPSDLCINRNIQQTLDLIERSI
jgi:UDP-glucose:(heptosyl)LPS alpha-1,3-glucosyltransferase